MTEPQKIIENHCRNYLPHIENQQLQMITFRLYDSVPKDVIQQWKDTLNGLRASSMQKNAPPSLNGLQASSLQQKNTFQPPRDEARRLLKLLDKYEDAGYGQCYLRDDRAAEIVRDALFYYDQVKYEVISWCIMPNHVHVLISLLKVVSLSEILHSWRSFSSNEINKLFNRKGQLWMPEYFDRYIRDQEHFNNVVNYIHNNPVKAGLVDDPTHYRWSSAFVDSPVGSQASSLHEDTSSNGLRASSPQENAPSQSPNNQQASSPQNTVAAQTPNQQKNEYNPAGRKPADQIGQRE